MKVNLQRPYRKNLAMRGFIYLEGQEQAIVVRNISISGLLAEIYSHKDNASIFNDLLIAKEVDIYLPSLRLAGEVDIVRVDKEMSHINLGLHFKSIAYNVDKIFCHRNVHRKNIAVAGQLLLNNSYIDFITVNVSVKGLMIHLNNKIQLEKGATVDLVFEQLRLRANAEVIWIDKVTEVGMLVGLHYRSLQRVGEPIIF